MQKLYRDCSVHGYRLFDFIVRPDGEISGMGCTACFRAEQGIPEPPQLPFVQKRPRRPSPAAIAQSSYNRETADNLRRWKESDAPSRWVIDHHGSWNHDDWLQLLLDLTGNAYWPMKHHRIGQALESEKVRYFKRAVAR